MDLTQRLLQTVADGVAAQRKMAVTGSGSKRAWLPVLGGEMVSTLEHTGITDYQPTELVVTARAGTSLRELNLELSQQDQELAADPPRFTGHGTIGGAVASGFSGPSRPWRGSLRDSVLGVGMINGRGEHLQFGGQVMKNVAGYDVSRLVAGSFGALGLITEVSLRVQPIPEQHLTLAFELSAEQGIEHCRSSARQPLPSSASAWLADRLYLRFSGTESALQIARDRLGGEAISGDIFWNDLRDHRLEFFKASSPDMNPSSEASLWRIVTPAAATLPTFEHAGLCVEWGGGLRWLWHDDDQAVADYAAAMGGWAWQVGSLYPLDAVQRRVMSATKQAFDPQGLFTSMFDFGNPPIGQSAVTNSQRGANDEN